MGAVSSACDAVCETVCETVCEAVVQTGKAIGETIKPFIAAAQALYHSFHVADTSRPPTHAPGPSAAEREANQKAQQDLQRQQEELNMQRQQANEERDRRQRERDEEAERQRQAAADHQQAMADAQRRREEENQERQLEEDQEKKRTERDAEAHQERMAGLKRRRMDEGKKCEQQQKFEEDALRSQHAEFNQRQKELDREKKELEEKLKHQEAEARKEWPQPPWLDTSHLNFAVVGASGTGKSSMMNKMMQKKPTDQGAAPVGVNETTVEPTFYCATERPFSKARMWDLPGGGTELFPRDTYVRQMGLRYFDGIMVVSAARFTEMDILLIKEAKKFDIPFYLARSKGDVDISNEQEDHGTAPAATLQSIKTRLVQQTAEEDRVFVLSSRNTAGKFDGVLDGEWDRFLHFIAADITSHRPKDTTSAGQIQDNESVDDVK